MKKLILIKLILVLFLVSCSSDKQNKDKMQDEEITIEKKTKEKNNEENQNKEEFSKKEKTRKEQKLEDESNKFLLEIEEEVFLPDGLESMNFRLPKIKVYKDNIRKFNESIYKFANDATLLLDSSRKPRYDYSVINYNDMIYTIMIETILSESDEYKDSRFFPVMFDKSGILNSEKNYLLIHDMLFSDDETNSKKRKDKIVSALEMAIIKKLKTHEHHEETFDSSYSRTLVNLWTKAYYGEKQSLYNMEKINNFDLGDYNNSLKLFIDEKAQPKAVITASLVDGYGVETHILDLKNEKNKYKINPLYKYLASLNSIDIDSKDAPDLFFANIGKYGEKNPELIIQNLIEDSNVDIKSFDVLDSTDKTGEDSVYILVRKYDDTPIQTYYNEKDSDYIPKPLASDFTLKNKVFIIPNKKDKTDSYYSVNVFLREKSAKIIFESAEIKPSVSLISGDSFNALDLTSKMYSLKKEKEISEEVKRFLR